MPLDREYQEWLNRQRKRRETMRQMWANGNANMSLKAIGNLFGITPGLVHQIIKSK